MVAFVFLVVLVPVSAVAGVILDVRTGVYADGQEVPDVTDAVIVLVRWNNVIISENPSGPNRGISLRNPDSSDFPVTLSVGDVVTVSGAEVDGSGTWVDLVIDISGGDGVAITGSIEVPWFDTTHQDVDQYPDGESPWFYCPIHFTERFTISSTYESGFDAASIICGHDVGFGFFGDPIEAGVDDCFQGVRGFYWGLDDGMQVVADGLQIIDCSLPAQSMSLGAVKSLYK